MAAPHHCHTCGHAWASDDPGLPGVADDALQWGHQGSLLEVCSEERRLQQRYADEVTGQAATSMQAGLHQRTVWRRIRAAQQVDFSRLYAYLP